MLKLKPNQTDNTCHWNAGLGSCLLIELCSSELTHVRKSGNICMIDRPENRHMSHSSPPLPFLTQPSAYRLFWKYTLWVKQVLFQVWNPTAYQLFFIPLTRTSYQVGQEMYWNAGRDPIAQRFLRIPFFSGLKDEWVTDEYRITIICGKECYLIIRFLWESADQTIQRSLLI